MQITKYVLCLLSVLFFGTSLSAQVQGQITLLPDNKTYEVSIIVDRDLTAPSNIVINGQFTVYAATGGLELVNIRSINGEWEQSSFVKSPPENHSFDYYSIALSSGFDDVDFVGGQATPLFTFENNAVCLSDIYFIDDDNDPFIFNSQNFNVGNYFAISGVGFGNAFEGSSFIGAPCPEALAATASATVGTLNCHDDVTTMTINVNGGEPPYTVVWTNTETNVVDSVISNQLSTPITLQNISGGSYSIQITDAKNSRNFLSEVITAPDSLAAQIVIANANCEESQDGSVTVQSVNRNTAPMYEWSNGMVSTSQIINLDPGTYNLTLTDDNGCEAIQEAIVKMDGWIEMESEASDISCFGMNDGTLTVNANGKNFPFDITWDNGNQSGVGENPTNLEPGTYYVTATDNTGVCHKIDTLEIIEPDSLIASARIDSSSICELQTESIVTIEGVLNSRGAVTYSADGINFDSDNRFVLNAGQSYTLSVEDAAGCGTDMEVTLPEPSGLSVDLPSDLVLKLGDNLTLDPDYAATTNVNFQWSPPEGLSCDDCPNPEVVPTNTTTYTLKVSDDNGCVKETSVIVYLLTDRRVYTPNIFSPNGDGSNDLYTIFTSTDALSVNTLQIFDRWGERVYESPSDFVAGDEFRHGWDGKVNGQIAPNGVYVFMAEISFIDGRTEIFSGELTLTR